MTDSDGCSRLRSMLDAATERPWRSHWNTLPAHLALVAAARELIAGEGAGS